MNKEEFYAKFKRWPGSDELDMDPIKKMEPTLKGVVDTVKDYLDDGVVNNSVKKKLKIKKKG